MTPPFSSLEGFLAFHSLLQLFSDPYSDMPFSKRDRVQSLASHYDEGTEDADGVTYSQERLAAGLGEFCYGEVTRVYVRKPRFPQFYGVKWDDGGTTKVEGRLLEAIDVRADEPDEGHEEKAVSADDELVTVTSDGEVTDEVHPSLPLSLFLLRNFSVVSSTLLVLSSLPHVFVPSGCLGIVRRGDRSEYSGGRGGKSREYNMG